MSHHYIVTMNGRQIIGEDKSFLEEQLFEARNALFSATSVREIKFLQSKIAYLSKQVGGTKKAKKK